VGGATIVNHNKDSSTIATSCAIAISRSSRAFDSGSGIEPSSSGGIVREPSIGGQARWWCVFGEKGRGTRSEGEGTRALRQERRKRRKRGKRKKKTEQKKKGKEGAGGEKRQESQKKHAHQKKTS
jgi:hypothetical protein